MKGKSIFIVPFLLMVLFVGVSAKNNVTEIDIDVVIREDGSAYVTQVWNGTFTEGTENYIPITTGSMEVNGIEISDFKVADAKGEYQLMPSWNVNASFEEKSGKCGMNKTKDGMELCFGISEYGTNRYAVEYVVHGFLTAYTDYDGANFMFINPDMSTFPTDGKIRITLASGKQLDESNAGIWGFGYSGQIEFQNGKVVAYTKTPLDGKNAMIVMLRLNKGLTQPEKTSAKSFAEVKDEALAGSDYATEDELPDWLANLIGMVILLVMLVALVLLVLALFFSIKRKIELKKFYKQADYFRDLPNGGNLAVTYYLSRDFKVAGDESLIIGATLLSMMNSRCIEPITDEKISFLGKMKTAVSLALLKEPEGEIEKRLYHILTGAAGEDGTLQEKELAACCESDPKPLREFMEVSYTKGTNAFGASNGFAKGGRKLLGDLSETGKAQLAEVMGLKKYLLDFSLLSEREIGEITIWQDYMVYAALFGIADKVLAQFKNVYPNRVTDFESYDQNTLVAYSYYRTMYRSARSAEQAARSSGMGGASSIGGGGGYSGGGSGGGSR